MPEKNAGRKVTKKEFTDAPGGLIDSLAESGPVVITSGGKPVAALVAASDYEGLKTKVEGYERMMKNLGEADQARLKEQAKALSVAGKRGRKV